MTISEELKWRGLVSNSVAGTFEQLDKEPTTFYVGTDPTGKSLHVGHLLAFVVAKLLQQRGHKPIVLVGGATASLGDPSFKAEERKLLTRAEIEDNARCIKEQLSHIIDFNSTNDNKAIMVNNYDWMKDFSFLDFSREIGKLITVNYMMSKDSVRMRLEREGSGLSFTEFTYQLLQGYDFLHLYEKFNCKMQIGGSDQWGNIMTGTEIIRKKLGHENNTFALVWPLVTKADGKKFGKSEGGKNIWLDPNLTTPYEFYQFWFNQSDDDAKKYIKMFTLLSKEEIEDVIRQHDEAPHLRVLQQTLAKEITILVHSEEDYNNAIKASNVLFKDTDVQSLNALDEKTLISALSDVPQYTISLDEINDIKLSELAVSKLPIFKSKGELRKLITSGGISINKKKISDDIIINKDILLKNKYLLLQRGKKTYNLIIAK